ncbi:MAG TPA: RNA polymerase sigma factor [Streptosporangiaceae bacterium]|jgi:RNA polymerase sigma-70 factor (ECF subfamily)
MTAGPVTGRGAQAGDRGTAEELFRSAYPVLAGWVRRLVDDDDTAREITSEAFARLLTRWDRVERPQSYLFTIAANLVRDHWSTGERERRAIRSVTAGLAADPVTCPAQDVEVRSLIASLPARQRDPFLLHYYAGFRIREVAVLLCRPAGTIKADLFAARARLRAALGIPAPVGGPGRRPAPQLARPASSPGLLAAGGLDTLPAGPA